MATKIIKAWINGAIREIEVEDIISDPQQPSYEERLGSLEENEVATDSRLDKLEDKPVITAGNFLVGNGTEDMEEITPEDVLAHINGASVVTMTAEEYEALGEDDFNANTLYMLTDGESEYYTMTEIDEKVEELKEYTDTSVSGKADYVHSHDDLYYTETEVDELLRAKSDTTHNHDSKYDANGSANSALTSAKSYTDTKVSGLASTTVVDNKISSHNASTSAHSDIRDLIGGLTTRLNTLANSDDKTLDQMNEVVAYIKNNKSLIDGVTTSKVNVDDIVNNLTTNAANKVLSAAQGVTIKNLIDELEAAITGKVDSSVLNNYYTKTQVDNLELITINDIDTICGTTIQVATLNNEVRF